jgi:hypothetical protein
MAVTYTFQTDNYGVTVTVYAADSSGAPTGSSVSSGATNQAGVYSVSLPVGDYVGEWRDGGDTHRVSGTTTRRDVDAESEDLSGVFVAKALFDANTVLAATTDNTPAAVTMAASTILARLASGNIKGATVAEIKTLLAFAGVDITYDHTISGLAATNVKTALDELTARIVALETP